MAISAQVGYSPYYCSTQFRRVTGMTLRTYTSRRRLAKAALQLRDTRERVLDVALCCGYSSQEALTRAFTAEFGISPAEYRKKPRPLPLLPRREVLFPEYYANMEETKMEKAEQTAIRTAYIPEHKFLGLWDINADSYCEFWERHKDICDSFGGTLV